MKIGALTIGQSPRNDLIPEIEAFFKGAEIIQLGALDGLSKEQIAVSRRPATTRSLCQSSRMIRGL